MIKVYTLALVLAALAALVTCAPQPELGFEQKCRAEFNVTNEELDDLKEGLNENKYVAERKFKCFAKCFLDAADYNDANGKLDVEKIMKNNPAVRGSARTLKISTECKDKFEIEEDECEYPYKVLVCITLRLRELRQQDIEETMRSGKELHEEHEEYP